MENRKDISECLTRIHKLYKELKELVDNATNELLDDILIDYFKVYTDNIDMYFSFMKQIITRRDSNESDSGFHSKMTNSELEKYFDDNKLLLILT